MMDIIEHLEGLVFTKLATLKAAFALVKLETRLAKLSILPLVLNAVFLLVIVTTLWFLLMLLMGYGLMYHFNNIWMTITTLLITNLAVFFFVYHALKSNLKNISFEKTRDYLSEKGQLNHDECEKTIKKRDSKRR